MGRPKGQASSHSKMETSIRFLDRSKFTCYDNEGKRKPSKGNQDQEESFSRTFTRDSEFLVSRAFIPFLLLSLFFIYHNTIFRMSNSSIPQIPSKMRGLQILSFASNEQEEKTPYSLSNDIPVPQVGENDVLIKVYTAGYCHTEM